jgi:Uma2 family endonuclease
MAVRYPTRDGKPMAESDVHRENLHHLLQALGRHFADELTTYVSGNLMMFYVPGDTRRFASPDVFVVRGVPNHLRENYLVWEEKAPDLVVEFTSPSTRRDDLGRKFTLYRDLLRVREYFLFDPLEEYLRPSLQGHRLIGDEYVPIGAIAGRLPSEVLGLHLERGGHYLRLYNPETGLWLPMAEEISTSLDQTEEAFRRSEAERQRAEAEHRRSEAKLKRAETKIRREEARRREIEAEAERLRAELEALRRKPPGSSSS